MIFAFFEVFPLPGCPCWRSYVTDYFFGKQLGRLEPLTQKVHQQISTLTHLNALTGHPRKIFIDDRSKLRAFLSQCPMGPPPKMIRNIILCTHLFLIFPSDPCPAPRNGLRILCNVSKCRCQQGSMSGICHLLWPKKLN
jgi:hypothetical protein